jgi:hypothetical protein
MPFFVEDHLPLQIVEQPYFRDFMKQANSCWKPVAKKTVRRKIIFKGPQHM